MIRLFQTVVHLRAKIFPMPFIRRFCWENTSQILKPGHINIASAKLDVSRAGIVQTCSSSCLNREIVSSVKNHIVQFENLLDEIYRNQNDLTVNDVVGYVNTMFSIIQYLVIEDHQEKLILEDDGFIKLFKAIYKLVDQIPAKNLVLILRLSRSLHMPGDKNAVAAYEFISSTIVPDQLKKDILYTVLELEEWNDFALFKYFLKNVLRLNLPVDETLKKRFYERIKEEVKNKNKYLHHFLPGYAKAMENNITGIDYEKDLLDEVLSGMVKCNPNIQQLKTLVASLSDLGHIHDGLTEYLIDFLEKNSVVLQSHPVTSVHIINYVASSMYNNEKNHLLAKIRNILRNNLSLDEMLQFLRAHSEYFYTLLALASLGIFSNKELKHLSNYYNVEKNFRACNKTQINFLLILNQAVKVLHPNYREGFLNKNIVSIGIKMFNAISKSALQVKRREILRRLGIVLERSANVKNCTLVMCRNKLGYEFEVIVAVNGKGELYNFGVKPEDYNRKIFIEDILVPKDFELIHIAVLHEKQHSRNTLCPNGVASLLLQIYEKLGFSNVVVYEKLMRNMTDKELGNYLLKLIWDKTSGESGRKT